MGARPSRPEPAPGPHTSPRMDTTIARRPHRRAVLVATGALTVLVLTGCAAEVRSADAEPAGAGAPNTVPAVDVDRDVLETKWEAITGEQCLGARLDVNVDGVENMVMCTPDVIFSSHASASSVETVQDILFDVFEDEQPDHVLLTGDTWGIYADETTIGTMQKDLGGEISSVSGVEAGPQQPAPGIQITTADDMVAAYEQANGMTCNGEPERDNDAERVAVRCHGSNAMAIFDSPELLQEEIEGTRSFNQGLGSASYWLVGEDWQVESSLRELRKLQRTMGGEIISMS